MHFEKIANAGFKIGFTQEELSTLYEVETIYTRITRTGDASSMLPSGRWRGARGTPLKARPS